VDAVISGETAEERSVEIAKAAEFLAETLSPFEMSLRGFRENHAQLIEMIDTLRLARAATEAANRELEAFSYSVAHDLRAPLRGVDGFSLALLQDYADKLDEVGRSYLRHVRESAQQMGRLIDDLLALSRVTRAELDREPVDLSVLAEHVAAQLQSAEPGRRVEIVIAAGMVVHADPRLLRVALANLLGNAWKFTGQQARPRIEIGVTESGESAYFVRDNGAGFDMAYAPRLFGAFQRLHSVDEFEGTGIGLATVQRIVNRHGGRIWATAEVDRGATFFFTLGAGGAL
jgi:light-regulated signal transduction histidine kinase (bacteriophytochrome)